MSDTFITVVAIILAVVLVIVVPLVVTSQRVDNVSQLDVEALTSNFVDEMRATGKLTLDNYDKFLQNLTATGNTYDVSMEFKILDENPGKKSMQTTKDKIGENVYYSIYTTQIEEVLKSENTYNLKQGDMVSVTVRNTNLTLGQELKNFAYKIVGNDTYTISASNSGLIVGNGSTDVILANNVNEDTIGYTLRENDSNGTILNLNGEIKNKNGWTNQNVYVELYPINSTYNFDLLYYWRYANKTEDYITEYKNDGNNLVFEGEGKYQIQVYWKHSILEKYSNIKTMDIKIDRQKPTIGSVTSSNQKGNIGIISVKDVTDTGGSGLAASCYYYKWTDKDITTQPTAPTIDTDGWTINNTTTVDSDYNGKRCWVWVKDKAGNISEPKSADVENVVPKVIDFSLTNTIVKKGENLIIKPQNIATHPEGNIIDYKEISYVSSDSSVATVNSDGVATGLKGGTTEITCIIKNYNESTIEKTCILTVVDLSYSPNGGNFVLPYDNNTAGTATIKSTVTISGGNYAEYAWSTSNSSYPNAWTAYASKTGGTVSKTSTTASVYYLWTKVSDGYGNSVIYVSNAFSISANKIEIKPDKTSWTNGNIICSITYPDNTVSNTRKAAYGNSLSNAVTNSNSASPPTTSVTVSSNGYVYAQATDALGNKVTASLQITNIDKRAPSSPKITKFGSMGNNDWYNSNITIKIESGVDSTDYNNGCSGISRTTYILSGKTTKKETIYTGDIIISNEGETTITAYTYDKAGNRSAAVITVKKDVNHNWSGYTTSKVATCTESGSKYRTCTICGLQQTATVAALGHNATTGGSKVSDATCTAAAVYHHKCSRCGINLSSTYKSGNALGHTCSTPNNLYNDRYHIYGYCDRCGCEMKDSTTAGNTNHTPNRTSATCTESKKCNGCEYVYENALGHICTEPNYGYNDRYHIYGYCDRCRCEMINSTTPGNTNHTPNITSATCTESKRCTGCAYVYENALGHICTEPNYGYNDRYHIYGYCDRCRCEMINSTTPGNTGHDISAQGSLRSAATCTAAATYWKKCKGCAYQPNTSYVSSGNKLGHSYSVRKYCRTQRRTTTHCSRCGRCVECGNYD